MNLRLVALWCAALAGIAASSSFSLETTQRPKPAPSQLVVELKQLHEAARTSTYAYDFLAHLCNNIGPRLSGSPQAAEAVKYVSAELKRLGFGVQLEPAQVPHWVRGIETAELVEFPGSMPEFTQKIVVTALGSSEATPSEGLTADVISVRSFDELAALPKSDVDGKIVLFNHPFDERMAKAGFPDEAYDNAIGYRVLSATRAGEKGAVATLVRSVGGANYRVPHSGSVIYGQAPRIPAGAVAAEDADLISALVRQGRVRMHLTLTPQTLPDVPSFNVIADLKGTEHPEQVVILSAHLDSWDLGTGAIDDGSGVAMMMQAAEVLQRLNLHPKRTIRFVAWMNEENGMKGIAAYLKDHEKELPNHVAAIENDDGPGHALGYYAHANHKTIEALAPLAEVLADANENVVKLSYEAVGSDTEKLEDLGIAGFTVLVDSRDYFNYHHTAADTFDKVDPHDLQEDSAVTVVLAYALASVDGPFDQ